MKKVSLLLSVLGILSITMLAGCGTKGDLTIPEAYRKYYEQK